MESNQYFMGFRVSLRCPSCKKAHETLLQGKESVWLIRFYRQDESMPDEPALEGVEQYPLMHMHVVE